VALPGGLVLAAHQARALAAAAPAATARGLAAGTALLAYGLFLRHSGDGDRLHHLLLVLVAGGALAAPPLAARGWRDPDDRAVRGAWALTAVSLAVVALLFVPGPALRPGTLIPALALAVLALALLRAPWSPTVETQFGLDIAICVAIAFVVVQFPDLHLYTPSLIHHQGFFLGPANDVLHGRGMLSDTWSQYGVGIIDAVALAFTVVPIGYGGLALILVALATAQFIGVYVILRLAGVAQALAALAIAVAALGNLFAPLEVYVTYPNATALRFGLPYLVVLSAVLGSCYPMREKLVRVAILSVLALAAVWSFESFVYCGATFGAVVLVEALSDREEVVRRVARAGAQALAACAAAVLLYSLLTALLYGGLDWGPYFEYLRLYSTEGFSQLPVVVFSAGPLMGAAIFFSAVTLIWLARARPQALAPPMRAALAGFTGFAVASFTYYLGRSHPNNLLVLLVPVVALGALWVQVLVAGRAVPWRTAAAAPLLLAGAMVAVAAWPSLEEQWGDTAAGIVLSGGSPRERFELLSHNPVFDPRAPAAAALLDEWLPPGAPAAVLTEPELTDEILLRAGRRNLLPISDPTEDALIASSADRVRAAAESIPAGTLLLTSPAPNPPGQISPTGQYRDFNALQQLALSTLQRRFAFEPVAQTPEGLELVRLEPRSAVP
jgi:hypothetical protein